MAVGGIGIVTLASWTFRNPLERFYLRHPLLSNVFRLAPGGLPALISLGSALITAATITLAQTQKVVYCAGYMSGREWERRAAEEKRTMILEEHSPIEGP